MALFIVNTFLYVGPFSVHRPLLILYACYSITWRAPVKRLGPTMNPYFCILYLQVFTKNTFTKWVSVYGLFTTCSCILFALHHVSGTSSVLQ